MYIYLPVPRFTRFRNLKLFHWMNQYACDKKVLNLGSGVGNFDYYLSKNIKTINLDMDYSKPNLDVIADAHFLPFKDKSFDIIYSIAVLEHVKKPWVVAEEMARILRPGGYVVLEVPFLNVIHSNHDYFRFTDRGIRSLFDDDKFEAIFEQVASAGGSFLSVFLYKYLQQFIPTRIFKIIWEVFMRYFFCLFKHSDILIDKSETMRLTANSFSYIGRKR